MQNYCNLDVNATSANEVDGTEVDGTERIMQKDYLFRSDDVEADLRIAGAVAIACIDPGRSSMRADHYHKDTIRLGLARM